MKIALAILTAVALSGCFSLSVPLGESGKYGAITVGYKPPAELPTIGGAKLYREK